MRKIAALTTTLVHEAIAFFVRPLRPRTQSSLSLLGPHGRTPRSVSVPYPRPVSRILIIQDDLEISILECILLLSVDFLTANHVHKKYVPQLPEKSLR